MSVINTARNVVFVHPPEPGHDLFVVTMTTPVDGSNLYKRLFIQPICQWQAAVDQAVGLADHMEFPLRVAAMGVSGLVHLYGDSLARGLETLTDAELTVLRSEMATTCADALRDCPDLDVRADAYDVLMKLGVFQ